jgi:hypothetical protein
MTTVEPQSAAPPPRPPFQFTLRTLLLLFVVAASSLGAFGAWGILVFIFVVGIGVHIREVEPWWTVIFLVLLVPCLSSLVLPGSTATPVAAGRVACMTNLRQIALAIAEYQDANGSFPPAFIADKDGKPMHSWRVLILPYMGYGDLYMAYKFDEPWDGPNNKRLLTERPSEFACPRNQGANVLGACQTTYLAVVGPQAAWAGAKPRKFAEIGADTASTILLIEAADSDVPWTKPSDYSADMLTIADDKHPPFMAPSHSGHYVEPFSIVDYRSGPNAAMIDCRVYHLPSDALVAESLSKTLRIGGYKVDEVESYEDHPIRTTRTNWPNIAALAVWLVSVVTLLTAAVRGRRARVAPAPTRISPIPAKD